MKVFYKTQKRCYEWNIESYNNTHTNKYGAILKPTDQVKIKISSLTARFFINNNFILFLFTNSSIKHQSFVYTQLKDQTVLFLTIQFSNVKRFYLIHR